MRAQLPCGYGLNLFDAPEGRRYGADPGLRDIHNILRCLISESTSWEKLGSEAACGHADCGSKVFLFGHETRCRNAWDCSGRGGRNGIAHVLRFGVACGSAAGDRSGNGHSTLWGPDAGDGRNL